jgi:hypothetical protein
MEEDALAFSECMRDQGIEDFPDPDFSDFGPGTGPRRAEASADVDEDGGGANGPGGAVIAGPFGEIDLSDPELQAAFEACQEEQGGPFGGRIGGPVTRAEDAKSS